MPIENIIVLILGYIYLAFILIIYIFNPFKWEFIKRSKKDD